MPARSIAFVVDEDVLPHLAPGTVLISAAKTCGFSFSDDGKPFIHSVESLGEGKIRRRCVWTMDAGKLVTFRWAERVGDRLVPREERIDFSEFRRRFEDPAWCDANAEHPIAYVRAAYRVHRHYAAEAKASPVRLLIRTGEHTYALIPSEYTEAQRAELLAQLTA